RDERSGCRPTPRGGGEPGSDERLETRRDDARQRLLAKRCTERGGQESVLECALAAVQRCRREARFGLCARELGAETFDETVACTPERPADEAPAESGVPRLVGRDLGERALEHGVEDATRSFTRLDGSDRLADTPFEERRDDDAFEVDRSEA